MPPPTPPESYGRARPASHGSKRPSPRTNKHKSPPRNDKHKSPPTPRKAPPTPRKAPPPPLVRVEADARVDFKAYFVRAKSKCDQRRFVADHALRWLRAKHAAGARGAIYLDIDDTIVDGNERAAHGFDAMLAMYRAAEMLFPIHLCTARPDTPEDRARTHEMLRRVGFSIPVDRLHMLPAKDYDGPSDLTRDFKDRTFHAIAKKHGAVLARFGDRLWDVSARHAPSTYLRHVDETDCYICWDPALRGTASYKLPAK